MYFIGGLFLLRLGCSVMNDKWWLAFNVAIIMYFILGYHKKKYWIEIAVSLLSTSVILPVGSKEKKRRKKVVKSHHWLSQCLLWQASQNHCQCYFFILEKTAVFCCSVNIAIESQLHFSDQRLIRSNLSGVIDQSREKKQLTHLAYLTDTELSTFSLTLGPLNKNMNEETNCFMLLALTSMGPFSQWLVFEMTHFKGLVLKVCNWVTSGRTAARVNLKAKIGII